MPRQAVAKVRWPVEVEPELAQRVNQAVYAAGITRREWLIRAIERQLQDDPREQPWEEVGDPRDQEGE